jgi:serine phosphatase RsbU (regulator of sigma subunit)
MLTVDYDWHVPALPGLAGQYERGELPTKVELLTRDAPSALIHGDLLPGDRTRASVAVGVFEGTGLVGVLCVSTTEAGREWTVSEIELLQAVALQIRTGVDLARIRERERNIASHLQSAILPELPAKLPGVSLSVFYSSTLDEAEVGGDFYDVYPVYADHYALVVADVSGKGLRAAAQIATVRHMLRALIYEHSHSVASAVTKLGDLLADHDLLEGFTTAFVGIYNASARTLEYVSCGQEPAILRRSATGDLHLLEATGPILGGFAGGAYGSEAVQLHSGDVLAVFTDGLTEAGQSRSHMLGLGGVGSVLAESCSSFEAPAEIAHGMMARVHGLVGDAGIRDDVCLLVVKLD